MSFDRRAHRNSGTGFEIPGVHNLESLARPNRNFVACTRIAITGPSRPATSPIFMLAGGCLAAMALYSPRIALNGPQDFAVNLIGKDEDASRIAGSLDRIATCMKAAISS